MNKYKTLCLPLSKSNWPKGRIGPTRLQDGYRSIKKAAGLLRDGSVHKILLLTATKPKNCDKTELEYMVDMAKMAGLNEREYSAVSKCTDTPSQIEFTIQLAEDMGYEEILIISSILHYPRVLWIIFRTKNEYDLDILCKFVIGIPRPTELITDIILTFAYPIMDLFGFKSWFDSFTNRRRKKGKL